MYIGKVCKIVNAKAIRFGKNVGVIMPYTILLCHEGGHMEIGVNSVVIHDIQIICGRLEDEDTDAC